MKQNPKQLLINALTEEAKCPNTIFLHKYKSGWIAYRHSALLLQHYFTPIRLKTITVGREKLICARWQGSIGTPKAEDTRVFYFSSEIPNKMTIRCPTVLTKEQTLLAMAKSGIRLAVVS